MKDKIISLFIVCLMLAGCATWVDVGGQYEMSSQNFSIDLPEGWRRYNLISDQLIITKEGVGLQKVIIKRTAIDEKLPFAQKKISADMLPQEVAEIVIDNFRSNPDIANAVVVANGPSEISGQPGFKLVVTFQTKEGLNKKGVFYGLLAGDKFYQIVYAAPQRYYFDKDLQAFEATVSSFKLLDS
jgi:hypothetical protein